MAATTVKSLRAGRVSQTVVVMQFLKAIQRKSPDDYLWVFEGQDIKYYAQRIEQFTGKQAKSIYVADGRSNVLECLKRFNEVPELHEQKVAFFADRDVLPPQPDPFLYVTPTYSIENLYITEGAFERALTALFGLAETQRATERDAVIQLYKKWISQFEKKLADLMAWIYIQQIDLALTSNKLNLKGVIFSKLFKISLNGRRLSIESFFGVRNARILFPNAAPVSSAELQQKKTTLNNTSWVVLGRGKYWTEFYSEIMRRLIEDSNSKLKIFEKKYKVHIQVNSASILDIFSGYADTPDCLITFLSARK